MVIDHEAVLADLKDFVASKPHHGSRDIAAKLVELEARHRLDESAPERAFRLYGVMFREDLRARARDEPPDGPGDSVAGPMEVRPDHPTETKQEVDGNGSSDRSQEPLRT